MQNVPYRLSIGCLPVSSGYSFSATANGCNFEIEPTYAHVKFDLLVPDSAGATSTTNIDIRHPGYTGPPVILDLDGDGVELVRLIDSTAAFDMDGDGVADTADR